MWKEGLSVKRKRISILLIVLLLLVSCAKQPTNQTADLWSLGNHYPVTYSKMCHVYHYSIGPDVFYLSVTRGKKDTRESSEAKDTLTVGDRTIALYGEASETEGAPAYTYYQCIADGYRYLICNSETKLDLAGKLSIKDAASILKDPLHPSGGAAFDYEEWTAYYRTDTCNLELYIYPNDQGARAKAPDSSYESRTTDGETYLYSEIDHGIVYTNGVHSVWIRQFNREGEEPILYSTVAECMAILAMLG